MSTPIPSLSTWEAHMLTSELPIKNATWQAAWWDTHTPWGYTTNGTHYNHWYYDQAHVFYKIAQYTGNTGTWYPEMANPWNWFKTYTEGQPRPGNVNGYELFPIGVYEYWLVNGGTASEDLMTLLATENAWTEDSATYTDYDHFGLSRELSYTILVYLYQQKMFGNAKRENYDEVIGYVKSHPVQWFDTYANNWTAIDPVDGMKPFMVGLTMRALIEHYDKYADAAVPGLIKQCLDGLWTHAWLSGSQAFYYSSEDPTNAADDLSLLIAPAYAWYYRQIVLHGAPGTAATYRDRGNDVWEGGVLGADLSTETNVGKRFNQNYTWSFDYVTWYNQAEQGLTDNKLALVLG